MPLTDSNPNKHAPSLSLHFNLEEPARSFTFNVTRAPNNQYNLTCRAGPTFPRPTLSLFRYRAGPIETAGTHSSNDFALPASGGHAHSEVTQARPRGLASTQLRQEPLVGLQTQITVSAKQLPPPTNLLEPSNEIAPDPSTYLSNEHQQPGADAQQVNARNGYSNPIAGSSSSSAFDIVAWALVDESSLSFNLATQFECVLNIEGATNYERRQSLALQRGKSGTSGGRVRAKRLWIFRATFGLVNVCELQKERQ